MQAVFVTPLFFFPENPAKSDVYIEETNPCCCISFGQRKQKSINAIRCLSSHSFFRRKSPKISPGKKNHWRIQRTEGRCCEMILPLPSPPSCFQTQHERITVGERRNSDPGNWILLPILLKLSEGERRTKVLQCLSELKSRKGNFLHETIYIFFLVTINN